MLSRSCGTGQRWPSKGSVWVEEIELGGVGEDEYSPETVGLELSEKSGRIAGSVKRKSDLAVHDDSDRPQCGEELPLPPRRGIRAEANLYASGEPRTRISRVGSCL